MGVKHLPVQRVLAEGSPQVIQNQPAQAQPEQVNEDPDVLIRRVLSKLRCFLRGPHTYEEQNQIFHQIVTLSTPFSTFEIIHDRDKLRGLIMEGQLIGISNNLLSPSQAQREQQQLYQVSNYPINWQELMQEANKALEKFLKQQGTAANQNLILNLVATRDHSPLLFAFINRRDQLESSFQHQIDQQLGTNQDQQPQLPRIQFFQPAPIEQNADLEQNIILIEQDVFLQEQRQRRRQHFQAFRDELERLRLFRQLRQRQRYQQ